MKKNNNNSLINFFQKYFLPFEENILFFDFNNINKILGLHIPNIYEFIYFNKKNFDKLLYDNEKIILIKTKSPENNFQKFFYLYLLLKDRPSLSNYIYRFDLINNLNTFCRNTTTKLKELILAIIIIQLINNYKSFENFYDINCEDNLKIIYEKNKKIINDFKNEENLFPDIIINNQGYNIEDIYLKIIISLIKNERLKEYEYSNNILEQLNLQLIHLTPKIINELIQFVNTNDNSINKYLITEIKDFSDSNKINFYYIILKFIFKNKFYLYNIPFLLRTKEVILNIIRFDINELNNDITFINIDDNEIYKRLDYIIKFFCDSEYYYNKYMDKIKKFKLKEVVKYYKNILFETKKEEIKTIEDFLSDLNINMDYEKYLKDFERAKKINNRMPIINYLISKSNINNKNEDEINKVVEKWYFLEDMIINKKMKKMRYDDKILLENYFNNVENKLLFRKIFKTEFMIN